MSTWSKSFLFQGEGRREDSGNKLKTVVPDTAFNGFDPPSDQICHCFEQIERPKVAIN